MCLLNITSRLAIRVKNLPDWNVDWSDTTPQRSRKSLTVSDFLPSVEDADHLMKRAKSFLMEFLAHEFIDLADLKPFVPEHQSPHPVCKSEVVPMKVLFKDEKYTAETIDILSQLMIDANLKCDPQVCTLIMSTCTDINTKMYVYTGHSRGPTDMQCY